MGLPWTLTAVPRRNAVLNGKTIDQQWDIWLTGLVFALNQRVPAVTYAELPANPVQGMQIAITDSMTTTWGDVITGGGADKVLAHWNGSAWTVAAK